MELELRPSVLRSTCRRHYLVLPRTQSARNVIAYKTKDTGIPRTHTHHSSWYLLKLASQAYVL
jgi:hypothetical protein